MEDDEYVIDGNKVGLFRLTGDIDGDRHVTREDLSELQAKVKRAVSSNEDFRYDLDGSGVIDASDVQVLRNLLLP